MVNEPVSNWLAHNTAETIFNRLEQTGRTWKVYAGEPDRFSATGLIHYPRPKDRFATHFVPFAQFEADVAGDLPDFSYIQPCLVLGHGDYHPAGSNIWNTTLLIGWDEPGGAYDHVPPLSAPAGQFGFTFDRSGYRVPAIVVSPWVAEGEVFNQEHRHTSLIATLRMRWPWARPCPPWTRPRSTESAPMPSRTTSRSTDCPPTPRPRSPRAGTAHYP